MSTDRRLCRLLLISALLLFLSIPATSQDVTGIDELVSQGIENYGLENYKTAYALFSRAMKSDPNHPEASKWFWKMKADHDVKNLRDKGTTSAESSAGAATTAADTPGIRYVYSEQEQHALLGYLESLDGRLSLLSEQIRAGSGVNKDEIDGRLLAISGDLAALSKELHTIDDRDDLGRQLEAIAQDVEILKERDVNLQVDKSLSSLSQEIRRLGGSEDLDDLEQRLTELQGRIQTMSEMESSRNVGGQLSIIGSELARLAAEQARAAEEAAKTRQALPFREENSLLLLVLVGCVVAAMVLLVLLIARQARFQRRATFSVPPLRSFDDMLATADNPPVGGAPSLSEVPAGQRENVIRQLTELALSDRDLRSRLLRSLTSTRSTEGRSAATKVPRTARLERVS